MKIKENYRRILKNFIALALVQGTNFLLPLVLMPHLNATIGIEKFGVVSFVQTVMIFLATFADFGFNLSATREIAIYKGNSHRMQIIVSKVLIIKLLLTFFAFLFLLILLLLVPKFQENIQAYLLGFSIVLGQALMPVWFFQGIEKMNYLTYLNLVAKMLFTILIFMFVKYPEHTSWVLLFFGLGNVISGVIGIWLIFKELKNFHLIIPSFSTIAHEIKTGTSLFMANLSVISYIHSNLFILGLFANDYITGIYSIAEKIILAMRQILVVFSQAIYPQVCQLAQESIQKLRQLFKKIFIPFVALYLIFCIAVFFFSDWLVLILAKKSLPEAIFLLQLLCCVPFIVALNIPANQTLLAYQHQQSYMLVLGIGSLLNILLNLLLAWLLKAEGTALSVILTETFITIGLHFVLHYKHPAENLLGNVNLIRKCKNLQV
ncbi:MAG: oligosaccharide flippase family protein [Microscillaceae bacterium]|nr:oligosaccharide flippase family protein [Microscillaceae bacterium]MDW8461216.1 oligosaccharide flippase family protein [Cytophagales bacterium]